MADTRYSFSPLQAEFPSSNFAALSMSNQRPVVAFDAAPSTSEYCYWTGIAPQGLGTTLTAVVYYAMASATTGGVVFDVAVEAVTPTDALDLDATTSFDTTNTGTDASVPATAGYMETISITLTNKDSIAAGDYFRLRLTRDHDHATDTATGDAHVFAMELRDA